MIKDTLHGKEYELKAGTPRLVTSTDEILGYLPLLAQEFAHEDHPGFSDKLARALQVNGATVFSDPTTNPRGADMFVLEHGEIADAISVAKYYSWNLLRGQLCLQPAVDGSGKVLAFSVRSMDGLLLDAGISAAGVTVASELAYNYVDPLARGRGYGKEMFAARIQRAIELKGIDDCILFTMSRGAHIDRGIGVRILNELMRRERAVQGVEEQQRITPHGLKFGTEELIDSLGIPSDTDLAEVHQASRPIVRFASSNQMQFV